MPSLPPALTSTTYTDGPTIDAPTLWTPLTTLVNAVRARLNPLTSLWQAVAVGTVTMASNTWTIAPLDTVLIDTDGLGISNNGYKVPADGKYLVAGCFIVANSYGGAKLIAQVASNGSLSADGTRSAADQSGTSTTRVCTAASIYTMTKGQILSLWGWGDPADVTAGATHTTGRCSLLVRRLP